MPADHRLILLSPFRNREPEKISKAFLDRLKQGDCKNAVIALGWSDQKQNNTCQNETAFPIAAIKLIDRIDKYKSVQLQYIWFGPGAKDIGSFLTVELRVNSGRMKIVDYWRGY